MKQPQSTYQSYLLRLWRDNPDGKWRASLVATDTAYKRHFPNLAALVAHLETMMGEKVILEKAAPSPNGYLDGRLM